MTKQTLLQRLRRGGTNVFGEVVTDDMDAAEAANLIDALAHELQQFVNGVETHMIDSPADDILANITHRAKNVLARVQS